MEHRHPSNVSQQIGIGYCHRPTSITVEHSYIRMGCAVAPENGLSIYPTQIVPTNGQYPTSQRDLDIRPFEHSSSSFLFKGQNIQAPVSWPSYQFFQRFPAGGRFYAAPENIRIHPSSGHFCWHTVDEVESGSLDHIHTQETEKGLNKRKRAEISVGCERGSSSRYYNAGCSSSSFEFQLGQPTSGYRNHPSSSICLPQYRNCSLLIHNEDSSRNVRGRYGLDLEINPRRTYSSNYLSHSYYSTARSQHFSAFSAAHGRFQTPGYCHDYYSNRNPFLPPSVGAQIPRENCNSYSPRTIPSCRAGLSTSHSGQGSARLQNGSQFRYKSFSSRYSRPLCAGGGRNNRFQSLPNKVDANARDRMRCNSSQMMVNRSVLYASRNLFDEYRELRLDIDNMSYEELLSLGERIGNVSTGLSKDAISKCLAKTTYCSLDENKEEGTCAICMEVYTELEEVGRVKNCHHDYHVGCIEKWLLVKNACPICQAPAVAESLKD